MKKKSSCGLVVLFAESSLFENKNEKFPSDNIGNEFTGDEKYYYLIFKSSNLDTLNSTLKKHFYSNNKIPFVQSELLFSFETEILMHSFCKHLEKSHHNQEIKIYSDEIFADKMTVNYNLIYKFNKKFNQNFVQVRNILMSSYYSWASDNKKNKKSQLENIPTGIEQDFTFESWNKSVVGNIDEKRKIPECTYLYILGKFPKKNKIEEIDNYKVGISMNAHKRLYDYQTHSPVSVKMRFIQSCWGNRAELIEERVKSYLRRINLYQEWYKINYWDLENIILNFMKDIGQPRYKVTKFSDKYGQRIFINYNDKLYLVESRVKISIFLTKYMYGNFEENKIKKIKDFEDYKSVWEYFYSKVFK